MSFANFQKLIRRQVVFLAAAAIIANSLSAAEVARTCGAHRDRLQAEVQLHRKAQQKRAGRGGGVGPLSAGASDQRRPATSVAGDLILMEDGDGVVSRRNDFDLDNQTVSFAPASSAAESYRFSVSGGGYDANAALAGTLIEGFGDDDTREIALPFSFPFYGREHSSVHVNSDGNITMGAGDTDIGPRSLDRLTSGLPRVAPLFRDLDPTRSPDGVRVLVESNRLVVSWVDVPEFSTFGSGPRQTFQVTIQADGRISFAYETITTVSAVVGISPGGGEGSTRVVSFVDGSPDEFSGTVAERFTFLEEVDVILASQKFFKERDDAYDYLVFYNNLGIEADVGTVAFEITIRNRREGIGDPLVDFGEFVGSKSRLQAILNLGPLNQYPENPNAVVARRFAAGDTPLTVLGHEAGHLFLAFASVRNPGDPDARPMLGRDGAHWSFVFNSEASLLEGNRICDREVTPDACPVDAQATRRFVTVATVEGYSPLDQYLMGLRAPWDVPDTFVVENPSIFNVSQMPQKNVNFNGQRRDIQIDALIAAEGRRSPDHTVSQRTFRFAFVLVHAEGTPPSPADVEKVDRYRREFEQFYSQASDGRAVADTRIRRGLGLSLFPATGLLAGSTVGATVAIEEPAQEDLDVLLGSESGAAGIPSSVRIPAGATAAVFNVTGARAGVDVITADVSGGGYETAEARVQVADALSGLLRLEALAGNKQAATPGQPLPEPVVVRATDINNLPYPAVRLRATASGDGSVQPTELLTNSDGLAGFQWTPDGSGTNELRISVADAAGFPELSIFTTGAPATSTDGVVNAASFAPLLAPGSLASIFGANLSAGENQVAGFPLPTAIAGVQILLNGRALPLLFISDRQINFVVPLDIPAGEAGLVVSTPLGMTGAIPVTVRSVAPGVFTMPGTGEGAVLVAGTGKLTSQQPAAAEEALEIFCTGLGPVRPGPNGLEITVASPDVTIGGVNAEVLFSGLAPGFVGLYQVNVLLPGGLAAGTQPLKLAISGVESPEVPITVR